MTRQRRLIALAVALLCLALVGVALLGTAKRAPVRGNEAGYRLTSPPWRVTGSLSGSGYVIQSSITGTGTPCCCGYLPCVLRAVP